MSVGETTNDQVSGNSDVPSATGESSAKRARGRVTAARAAAEGNVESDVVGSVAADAVGGSRSLSEVPLENLEERLVGLAHQLAVGTYELLLLVGELDVRGGWAITGALSCAAWLADICDIEVCTARTQVRVANAMRRWPSLDVAMRDGDVSYAKARTLVPHLSDENVDALIGIATVTPAGRLGIAIAAWMHRNEDDDVIAERLHEARSCTWRTEPDGMVTITARLTPEVAGTVCAVIDQQMIVASAPAGASVAQQRADAFAAVVTQGGGKVDAEVVIHVREDGNTLTDGTPVSDHAVVGLLPDAFVSLLFHDAQRMPIDASTRRRTPTRRQRRVLDERSDECAHPGCHARAYLQYDHIQRYADHGPTVIDNLQRLCGPHNREREEHSRGETRRSSRGKAA